MTINLTRIYTKLGDGGETHLGDMSRVPKTDPRIEAYGAVDELGAHIGVALTLPELPDAQPAGCGGSRTTCSTSAPTWRSPRNDRERLRLVPEQVGWLEQRCDEVNAELEPLRSFVLSGGTPAAAWLHVCRTVCRRAERRASARRRASTPRRCAISTGSAICCSSWRAGPTAAMSRCGSRRSAEAGQAQLALASSRSQAPRRCARRARLLDVLQDRRPRR